MPDFEKLTKQIGIERWALQVDNDTNLTFSSAVLRYLHYPMSRVGCVEAQLGKWPKAAQTGLVRGASVSGKGAWAVGELQLARRSLRHRRQLKRMSEPRSDPPAGIPLSRAPWVLGPRGHFVAVRR